MSALPVLCRTRPVAAALLALVFATPGAAAPPPNAALPSSDTLAGIIEKAIENVFERRPELVASAMARAEAKARESAQAALSAKAVPTLARARTDAAVPRLGPTTAKLTIAEFFDYNCGYCRAFHERTALPLLKARSDLAILMIHTPVLGPGSQRLAEIAQAAHDQGRFEAVHDYLMRRQGNVASVDAADALIAELVKAAGLDETRLRADLAHRAPAEITRHRALVTAAGVEGTPLIVTPTQAIPGAIPLEPLTAMLAAPNASGGR